MILENITILAKARPAHVLVLLQDTRNFPKPFHINIALHDIAAKSVLAL
jgi:hypothetical protein